LSLKRLGAKVKNSHSPTTQTAPFGSTVHHPFRFTRRKPIQQEICSKSRTTSPAHDPVRVLNNSPAKTGLVLKLSSSIKRRAEPGKRGNKKKKKGRGRERTGGKTRKKESQGERQETIQRERKENQRKKKKTEKQSTNQTEKKTEKGKKEENRRRTTKNRGGNQTKNSGEDRGRLKQRKGKAKFLHNFGSRKQQKKTGGSTGDRSNTRSTGTNHSQNHKKKEERRRKTCSRPGKQSVLLAIFCLICICTVQVNFNSLAQCRNTRGLARVLLCPARASDEAGPAGSSPAHMD